MNLHAIALMIATAAPPAGGPPDLPDSTAQAPLVPDAPPLAPAAPSIDPFRPPSSAACPQLDPTEPAEARQARAQEAIARADALFREAKYGESLAQIDQAACAWPHRDYDFMRASVHEQRGDCQAAIEAYERFLTQEPPVEDARVAHDRIRACKTSEAMLPVTAPPPPRIQPEPAPMPEPKPAPEPKPKHWSRDIPGGVMLGVGLVGMGVGTGLLVAESRDTTAPSSYDAYVAHQERMDRMRIAGRTVLAVSSVAIAAAVVRYVVVARRGARGRRELARR